MDGQPIFYTKTLTEKHCRAVPNPKIGGYDLYKPSYAGHCTTEAYAIEWLDIQSGNAYQRLTPVTKEQLTIHPGQKQRGTRGTFYQQTFYYLNSSCLGNIQTKWMQNGQTEISTNPYDTNYCIPRGDLDWLLNQKGFRLVQIDENTFQLPAGV